jgi:pSer/pThr/pTyr-binding forkhead associated (FHA) protein
MPFIILGQQRFALPIGETRIGGSGAGALPFAQLAGHATIASLWLTPDGVVSLRGSGDRGARVLVDGAVLDGHPVTLTHGATIEVAGLRLVFGELRDLRTTTKLTAIRARPGDEQPGPVGDEFTAEPTVSSGGTLAGYGASIIMIPDSGLVIGRAPDSDLVIPGRDVSRRHAVIRPSAQGYMLRDVSTNGTYVNGRRVNGTRRLARGDMIRIGTEELRFDTDPTSPRPAARPAAPVAASISAQAQASILEPPTGPRRAAAPIATLDVIDGGPLTGVQFGIEQRIVGIGRDPHNEVQIDNASVSRSHATLAQRVLGWVVVDYGSANGTFVNGERIAGEQQLPDVAELRFGSVTVIFRVIVPAASGDTE